MTPQEQVTFADFLEAKAIALTIEKGHYRRPNPQNPFLGGNLRRELLGTVVLWEDSFPPISPVQSDGKVKIDGRTYHYRSVNEFTGLFKS